MQTPSRLMGGLVPNIDPWERNVDWQLLIAQSYSNRAITRLTRAAGLTPGQPKVLQYLTTHDGCTQKEIGQGCALDKSTVAGLLARMEADGLVTRRTRPGDRRATGVFLTDRGAACAETAARNAATVDELALAGFTAPERAQLSELLARVIRNLREQEGSNHENR